MRKVCLALDCTNDNHLDDLCGLLNLDQSKVLRLALETLYLDLYDQIHQYRDLVSQAKILEEELQQRVDFGYIRSMIRIPANIHQAAYISK